MSSSPPRRSSRRGFNGVRAASRAGVFDRKHATEQKYEWLLRPWFMLPLHHLWDVAGPLGFLTSDATVSIDQNGRSREARTIFDDETIHATVNLRFLQSPMQNQITCPNRSASTTHPSFQSDSIHTPFDGFSLPATDDAQTV